MITHCRKEALALLTALSFLSRLGPARCLHTSALSYSVRYFPIAGLCIGMVQTLGPALLGYCFPGAVFFATWLYMASGFMLTRGLHWDAVADIGDAWGSGATGETFWRILKDSRMGAYGAMSLLFTFTFMAICTYTLCLNANWLALAFAPAWGRLCGTLLAGSTYAHSDAEHSLGAMAHAGASPQICLYSSLLGILALFCWLPWLWALFLICCSAALIQCLRVLAISHGGLNGDFLGAAILWTECLFLCSASI